MEPPPRARTCGYSNIFTAPCGLAPGVRLLITKPDGKQQQLDVMARVEQGKRVLDVSGEGDGSDIFALIREEENESHLHRHRYLELGDDLFIWKMLEFVV